MTRRRRFGSVRQLPSGRWQARFATEDGRIHTAPATYASKRDAERHLVDVEAEMNRGAWHDPSKGRETFADWVSEYFRLATHKRPTTLARDKAVARTHLIPALGSRPLGRITPLEIQRLVVKMSERLAPATVRTNYGVLRTILAGAVDAELIARSPCRGIRLPPAQRQRSIRFLTPEELTRLAAATPVLYRPTIFLAGVLGMRWSEIAGLRVDRVDLLRNTLEVTETIAEVDGRVMRADVKSRAARRTLELPSFLVEMLAEHLVRRGLTGASTGALLFVAPDGGPLRPANFRSRVWAPAVRAAGLDRQGLTFHHLRHSAVGFLIDGNASLAVMQRRLGHASIRTTLDVYGHVLPTTDRASTAHLESLFAPASGTPMARPAEI